MIEELKEICAEVRGFIAQGASHPESEQFAEPFERLARRIFEFQFTWNKPYQAYCRSLGRTPGTVKHFSEIPAVVTSAFKELELTVLPAEERKRVFYSSGTTREKRSRHYHNVDTLWVYEESLLRGFKRFVLPDQQWMTFLSLVPGGEAAVNSSLAHMVERAALEFGEDIYSAQEVDRPGGGRGQMMELGYVDVEGIWQAWHEEVAGLAAVVSPKRPVVICGTAFSFVHLCDYLAERKEFLTFPAGSRVFETGGYKGRSRTVPKEELHGMISRRLGIPEPFIVSEYGMSELSSQAYDRVAGEDGPRLFRFPPWVRWKVISPENGRPVEEGETGLVRIWDLANVGSVVAIQTEDLATRWVDGFVLAGRAAQAEARGCSLMTG